MATTETKTETAIAPISFPFFVLIVEVNHTYNGYHGHKSKHYQSPHIFIFFDFVTFSKFCILNFLFEVLNEPAHIFLRSESLFRYVLECFFKLWDCVVLEDAL